jgi:large conductance mechanosensitive channel
MAVDREFRDFIKKFGLGVAIGIIIANAIQKIVYAINDGFIKPLINFAIATDKWSVWVFNVGTAEIKIGEILAAAVDFFVIALLLFFFVKLFLGTKKIRA